MSVVPCGVWVVPLPLAVEDGPPSHEPTCPVFGQGVLLQVRNGASRPDGQARVVYSDGLVVGLDDGEGVLLLLQQLALNG